ncbi:hypothetical protein BC830DRAFT_1174341 [Chytriomyces sp. MP71]|nr:hypothetical protein BC830DRAFT_1174341 [Chytriomyces sp. MP71]
MEAGLERRRDGGDGVERRTTDPSPAASDNNQLNDLPEGEIESNWDTVVDKFDDMQLKEELLRGVYSYGCV